MKIGKKQILCVCGGVVCFLLAQWVSGMEDIGKTGALPRNSYGQGETDYELLVDGLFDGEEPIQVTVGERRYTEDEAEAVFENVMSTIGERVLEGNASFSEVREDLNLVTWLSDEGVKIRWSSDEPDIMDSFGHIKDTALPKDGVPVWLTAYLMAGEYSEKYEIPIRVLPPLLTEREETVAGLLKRIAFLDRMQQTKEELRLPGEYGGNTLHYRDKSSTGNEILLVLGVLMAVLCYARDKMEVEEKKKRRSREMMADYSEIVFKLMVFIGAGMTVLNAWERLVLDYQERLKRGRVKPRAAYEEMGETLHQISCGVSEGQALISFGKRCQLQPYLKLSSLLEQNRKTGTKNLKNLLEAEMNHAWEQRKTMARRLGEEAGTKLLVPLFLMLGIVMVIIMVPAMMSMT